MRTTAGLLVAFTLFAASCGGSSADPQDGEADNVTTTAPSSSGESTETSETVPNEPADDVSGEAATSTAPSSGGGAGTLVLGAETIELDSSRCFMEAQDAAGGGGKILFVAQAFGETAAGEPIIIDVSRYDEDSQFTGDDITIDIGDPFSGDAISMSARTDLGTVSVNGSNLSAGDLVFQDSSDFTEQGGAFEINC